MDAEEEDVVRLDQPARNMRVVFHPRYRRLHALVVGAEPRRDRAVLDERLVFLSDQTRVQRRRLSSEVNSRSISPIRERARAKQKKKGRRLSTASWLTVDL